MLNFGLKGKVICVTGGASGIGRSSALAAANDGADVAIIDLRQDDIDKVLSDIRAFGVKASGFALDVRDSAAIKAAADQFESDLGPVTGMIACAGISRTAPAAELDESDFMDVIEVNVKGVFLCAKEFGGRMIRAENGGAIVLIGSVDGLGGHPGRTHYVASKHAVSGLTKNFAIEWGRYGIRVNCIAPGLIDTPLLRANIPPGYIVEINDRTPLGRMGKAEEMAAGALMLLSEACSFMTGAIIPIDGGITAGFLTRQQGGDYASKTLLKAGIYSE